MAAKVKLERRLGKPEIFAREKFGDGKKKTNHD
jgi:hypothetical protein